MEKNKKIKQENLSGDYLYYRCNLDDKKLKIKARENKIKKILNHVKVSD